MLWEQRLALAVAFTGLLATMPYIALQLEGMQVVLAGLGVQGDLPLVIAFVVLAAYTYFSGLRAPAMIAVAKDLTKVWPHADYPPITIGRLVLDRNPENFFAQIEQAAFEPSNMVQGIGPGPDKMLLGRLFSYHDTHLYRIGTNYQQLPVNRPQSEVHSYNQDGHMRYGHRDNLPVYAPNSYGGPKADPDRYSDPAWFVEAGEMVRTAYTLHAEDDDFIQAGNLYRDVMSPTDRDHLVSNLIVSFSGVEPLVLERSVTSGVRRTRTWARESRRASALAHVEPL